MGLVGTSIPLAKLRGSSQRLVVDSALHFESFGARCDWESFVFLALGLGVDPYHGGLQGLLTTAEDTQTIRDSEDNPVMILRRVDGGSWTAQLGCNLSFSARRAMAVAYVMILPTNDKIGFIPLGQYSAPAVAPSADQCAVPTMSSIYEAISRAETPENHLSSALTWMFYLESVFYGETQQELLPVPQSVLQAREKAVAELGKIVALADTLNGIFRNKPLEDKIIDALELAKRELPSYTIERRPRRRALVPENCPTYVDIHDAVTQNPLYQQLRNQFYPPPAALRGQNIDLGDLKSQAAVLARVILGISIVQVWQREEWKTLSLPDGSFAPRLNRSPLKEILNDGKVVVYVG
jgi:hypothetical protein